MMRQLAAKSAMECAKIMLFGVNIMYMITGFILMSIGATIKTVYIEYDTFMINHYFDLSKSAIAMGIIVILISLFGCIAAIKRSVFLINIYALILSCIFIVSICLSLAAFLLLRDVEKTVEVKLYSSMGRYNSNYGYIWNTTQSRFHCCGVRGPEDWRSHEQINPQNNQTNLFLIVPDACCMQHKCVDENSVYTYGCLNVIVSLTYDCIFLLGSGTMCVALIEFLGVIFATLLAKSVRKLKTQIEVDKMTRRQHLYEQLAKTSMRTDNPCPVLYTPSSSEA